MYEETRKTLEKICKWEKYVVIYPYCPKGTIKYEHPEVKVINKFGKSIRMFLEVVAYVFSFESGEEDMKDLMKAAFRDLGK